ncbi:MAG: glycerate kinase [bacterium]
MGARRVLVAPDKFKEALPASRVASALGDGLRAELGDEWSVREHPLADGGEGTVEAIVQARNGEFVRSDVRGPRGETVEAEWGLFREENTKTAVIEMAAASGFNLIDPETANPLKTTTYGTGELIKKAVDRDVDRILVGLGGSATVDGGLGAARALGYSFYDSNNSEVKSPESLGSAARVDDEAVAETLSQVTVTLCSDVDNPLLGESGAARVYGPQKGADEAMVERLEQNLTHWANLLENYTGRTGRETAGAGAAGGLGFGLALLLDGSLVPGAQKVMDVTDFNSSVRNADVVVTGEGKIDRQTGHGKTPAAAAKRARQCGNPVVFAVAGQRSVEHDQLLGVFDVILSIMDRPMSLREALDQTGPLLKRTGRDLANILSVQCTSK